MVALTQEEARQHALQAQRGNMRSLEILLNELIGGDISLDNLTVTTATMTNLTTNDITGGDSSLAVDGLASTQGGTIVITGGTSSTAANAGGAVSVVGGTPGSTGIGGAVSITGGGAAAVTTTTGAAGGVVTVETATGSEATGAAGIGGASGALVLRTGAGGAASNASSGVGGAAGAFTIDGGDGGAGTSGDGGDGSTITITAGNGGAAAAAGDDGGEGGNVALVGGVGGADGDGGSGIGAKGGDVTLTGGVGGAGSSGEDGGDVIITSGAAAGSGQPGIIALRPVAACVLENISVVADSGATTTMTVEIATSVVHAKDPAGSITYTTPTGAQLTAHFASQPATGDSFLFSLVNTGNTTAEDIALAAGASGITMVGSLVVLPNQDVAEGNIEVATWRVVNTDGANAWTWYRIS